MSAKSILGLYTDPEHAANAMDNFKEAGFEQGSFDVLTGTPYPEGAFGEYVPQHRLFRFPAFGAIMGFMLALLLTAGTQIAYPLVTGGKPILSIFAMLIILYELTMLSAVIMTVVGIIFESRLPNLNAGIYDRRITEGYIGVVVNTEETRLDEAQTILRNTGAEDIRR